MLSFTVARSLVQLLDLFGLAAVGLFSAGVASRIEGSSYANFLGVQVFVGRNEVLMGLLGLIALFFATKSLVSSVVLKRFLVFLASLDAMGSKKVSTFLFGGGLIRKQSKSRSEIIWLANRSSELAVSTIFLAASTLLAEGILLALTASAFFFVDAGSALFLVAYFGAVIVVFQNFVNSRMTTVGEKLEQSQISTNAALFELFDNYKELEVAGRTSFFLDKFFEGRKQYAAHFAKFRYAMGLPRFVVETALIVGALGLVVWQFTNGAIDEGIVTAGVFLAGGLRMMASILPLQNALSDLKTIAPQIRSAQEILELAAAGLAAEDAQRFQGDSTLPKGEGPMAVTCSNLSFRYPGQETDALANVSVSLEPGSLTVLAGGSGAGKTTFADLCLGLLEPSQGSITVAGVSPSLLHATAPNATAYVPQNPGLFAGTLLQNICFGLEQHEASPSKALDALSAAGLGHLETKLPAGLDTQVGPGGWTPSGGELQRLGIARGIYSNASLIVLDEPTSNLDVHTEKDVWNAIEELRGKATVIVIAHRLHTIKNADRILLFDRGRLVGDGRYTALKSKNKFFGEMLLLSST